MDFNQVIYVPSKHAVDEYIKRTRNESITFEEAESEVTENLYKAKVIIENKDYRYLKYGLFYYPCGIIRDGNRTIYRATTTLTRSMLEAGDYFDVALEKYTS